MNIYLLEQLAAYRAQEVERQIAQKALIQAARGTSKTTSWWSGLIAAVLALLGV